jgi:hypothetical protein
MLIQKINIKKAGKSRPLYIMHCKADAFWQISINVEFTLDYLGIRQHSFETLRPWIKYEILIRLTLKLVESRLVFLNDKKL